MSRSVETKGSVLSDVASVWLDGEVGRGSVGLGGHWHWTSGGNEPARLVTLQHDKRIKVTVCKVERRCSH